LALSFPAISTESERFHYRNFSNFCALVLYDYACDMVVFIESLVEYSQSREGALGTDTCSAAFETETRSATFGT